MLTEIPYGYCHCGCGSETRIHLKNHTKHGYVKGEPNKFILNHGKRMNQMGTNNPNWNGGRFVDREGYVKIFAPEHPRCTKDKYVFEHIVVIEQVIGRPLNVGEVVHHIDRNKQNNNSSNLVLCRDVAHHMEIHRKGRAAEACGNPEWRKCVYCKEYDDPSNLVLPTQKRGKCYHKSCMKNYNRQIQIKRTEKNRMAKKEKAAGTA